VAYDRGHQQDLAEACKTTAVVITRATQTLIAHGWCRKSEETGRFLLHTAVHAADFRVLDDCQRHEQRMADARHSLTGQ
jgi:DNA-binding IclR family transcriptional regulator